MDYVSYQNTKHETGVDWGADQPEMAVGFKYLNHKNLPDATTEC